MSDQKYVDYFKKELEKFKEDRNELIGQSDFLRELQANIVNGLTDEQKAELDGLIDDSAPAPQAHDHGGIVVEGDVWRHEITLRDFTVGKFLDGRSYFEGNDGYGVKNTLLKSMIESSIWTLITPSPKRQELQDAEGQDEQARLGAVGASGDCVDVSDDNVRSMGDQSEQAVGDNAPSSSDVCDGQHDVVFGDSVSGDDLARQELTEAENDDGNNDILSVAINDVSTHIDTIEDGGNTSGDEEVGDGRDSETNTRDIDRCVSDSLGLGAETVTQTDAGLGESTQDSPVEEPAQQFHVGDVVEGGARGLGVIIEINYADCAVKWQNDPCTYWTASEWLTLIHHTDVPCPGEGWKRNMGVMPEGEVEAVAYHRSSHIEKLISTPTINFNWDLEDDLIAVIAWYLPKENKDEQDTEPAQGEEQTERADAETEEVEEVGQMEAATNGNEEDEQHGVPAEDDGDLTPSTHPLAEWIMKQDWDMGPIEIDEVEGEPAVIRFDEGEKFLIYTSVSDFLANHTPKGWDRFYHVLEPAYEPDDQYECVYGNLSEPLVKSGVDIFTSMASPIFIREHKPEISPESIALATGNPIGDGNELATDSDADSADDVLDADRDPIDVIEEIMKEQDV